MISPKKVKGRGNKATSNKVEKRKLSKPRSRARESPGSKGVCMLCEGIGEKLVTCQGGCFSKFHLECLGITEWPVKGFKCQECTSGTRKCFVCGSSEPPVLPCKVAGCGKCYHDTCISQFTCGQVSEEGCIRCPRHVCTTCTAFAISKNDENFDVVIQKKLARCIYCPVSYHASEACLPAGCKVLNSSAIICNKHLDAKVKHVNVGWCFACSQGGNLICCELCPASYHENCLDEKCRPKPNEDKWFCRGCIDGKFPVIGDIVWVKIGAYRWWPAEVCNRKYVPDNILALKHGPGEFSVQFLGSHDYSWTSISRIFGYEEEDIDGRASKLGRKGIVKSFGKALKEAEEKFTQRKISREKKEAKSQERRSQKPPSYKHIKMNKLVDALIRPNLTEYTPCSCKPTDEAPCGSSSNCINRMLMCECNSSMCPAGDKCQNQRFQKLEYAKSEIFKSNQCGWGLKSAEDIYAGTLVVEYVGELLNEKTCYQRIKMAQSKGEKNFYMLNIDKDVIIDAGQKGNLARFMNHSCQPNCETHKWTVNGLTCIGLFAIDDIKQGEELTFDYRLHAVGNDQAECHCGSKLCRKYLGAKIKSTTTTKGKDGGNNKSNKNNNGQGKRKKRKKRKRAIKHEDECYVCGDGGQLIMCSRKSCYKCYHLECLTIDGIPRGKWDCPWHHCDICGKAANQLCSRCPNSFCKTHANGRIQSKNSCGEMVLLCHQCIDDDQDINKSN
ncbi:uncharacterized protein TRIADDRAFT_31338 [Trichoplax adhaerens]|uniref:Histone-lysine N-methyltransferase n=1 Tax=Trichoplax adhaerens TaxID=10228 RepID=B3S8Y2_TRIAD|nr:hypothetical protein TRIADDRAFT_31338 [Trichoplax adhaerens]EDV20850.1 hypothetical protein TRIADDRAFT_31338 [Trichoplax adhaerens]|eukprot:XP_002116791.1 hypothetical protein TRIADDRAFT_31338 [Trichoplax adhaerens]